MSTFLGLIHEIPKISVDRFDGNNLTSEVFFLSHFHADHMVGLRSSEFHTLLRKKESAYIYCSELTALFLSQNHLQGLDKKIRALPVNKDHTICINEEHGFFTVTPLSAGHCPGSYMFLFNYKGLYHLYTGDFRMTRENLKMMKALQDEEGDFKPIETLYLDTTFFQPMYSYLPSRDESILEFIKLCKSWLQKGNDYVIDLRTPATIGVEYVLIILFKEFNEPVHVSDRAYEKYSKIPELAPTITKEKNSKLHACIPGHLRNGQSLFRRQHSNWKEHNILSIKLCALHARNFSKGKDLVSYSERERLHRLVYSSHSSQSELVEMIETLLPKKIEPCVVPLEYSSEKVVEVLQQCTNLKIERSDSDDMPVLQFSSYEDVAGSESDSCESTAHPQEVRSGALLTMSKYNVQESSEDEVKNNDSDDDYDELPPFRWDCFYDAEKRYNYGGQDRSPFKRRRIDSG